VTWVLPEKDAEAKSTDESGRPVLVTAAASGNAEALLMLFCKGTYIEAADSTGTTALWPRLSVDTWTASRH
jgi:hypothetical protein